MTSHSLVSQPSQLSSHTISLREYIKLKRIGLFGVIQYVIVSISTLYFFREFSLTDSWLSELGNKYLENGEVNTTPRYLWSITTGILSICLIIYFYKIPKTNKLTENMGYLIVFGTPFLALSGVYPRDTHRFVHDKSIAVFYICCSLAVLILSIRMINTHEKTAIGYFGLITALITAFYMIAYFLPVSKSPIRKTAQKILSYAYQAWFAGYIYYDPLNKPKIVDE